jgi:hypothetical protein
MQNNYRSMNSDAKRAFWQKHIAQWQQSGLSMKQYSVKHEFCVKTLSAWKKKLNIQTKQSFTEIPSHVVSTASLFKSDTIEILLQNGLSIRINNPDFLKQVLQTLGVNI